jgi:hypothetical protein
MRPTNQISYYGKPAIAILLAFATMFGVIFAFITPDWFTVNKYWIALTLFLTAIIAYVVWLAADFKSSGSSLPIVKSFLANESMLLVTNRDWLGIGVNTVIYRREGEFERAVCCGEVINIQRNGLVQIRIENEARNAIGQQDLSTLIIRPGGWAYGI